MDREAWWATAHGVPKSQTRLRNNNNKALKKKKKCWSIQSENSRMERRKRKRQEIKLENRLEQRKQHRGNDQREDVEKSPGINNCHENSE